MSRGRALLLAVLMGSLVCVSGDDAAIFVCGEQQGASGNGALQQSIPLARYNDDFCDCDDGR